MPIATLEGPPIESTEAKRNLVKEITDALEKAYKLPRAVFTVIIKENTPNNVGVGGTLLSNRE
ncbi:MAG: 4-oxalocrotonate tautomerase DmpI [Promethearchaeota archaeon]